MNQNQVAAICSTVCNPFMSSAVCTSMQDCKLLDTGEHGGCFALSSPPVGVGMSCQFVNDCDVGLHCLGNPGTCHHICDSSHMCPTGGTCTTIQGGTNGLGVCSN
jgi:hypothetical protein